MNRIKQLSFFKNFFIFVFSCLMLAACGNESSGLPAQGVDPSKQVASITITPDPVSLEIGETQQMLVTVTYADGSTGEVNTDIIWNSSNPDVASVTEDGLISAIELGDSTLTATIDGVVSSEVNININDGTGGGGGEDKDIASLQLSPGVVSIAKGTQAQYSLIAIYEDGTSEDITNLATWTSADTDVATIDANGVVSGVDVGMTTVKGSYLDVDSNASTLTINAAILNNIQVSPSAATIVNGATQQYVATGSFSDGTTQDLSSQVTWTSSDTSIATINADGSATALQVGTTDIEAEFLTVTSNTVTLTVTDATISTLQISPASEVIAKGVTQQYTATATYSDGTNQDVSGLVDWTSSETSVATIDATGKALGVSVGTTTILASYLGLTSNDASLEVTLATIETIQVSPSVLTIAKGVSTNFTATAILSDGSNLDVTEQVTWITSNSSVATIDANGLAQGNGVGTTTITAQQQGVVSNSASLTISSATVDSIQITPANATIANGTTLALSAIAILSDGSSQNITNLASWVTSDVSIATVNSAGVVEGTGVGSVTVTGQYQGVTQSVPVNITAATVASLQIAPGTATLAKGTTQAFTATATLSDGSSQDVSSSVTWQSSNTSIVTINHLGLATANNVGNTVITAQYQGETSNSAQVTVTSATADALRITPSVSTLAKGTTQAFTASATLSDGSSQDVTNLVTWQSSNGGVVSINNAGVATADNTGSTTITARYLGATSNTAQVTVTEAIVNTIQVTPGVASLAEGATQTFIATAIFSDSTSQNVSNLVTWQSNNTTAVTINNLGLATANAIGSAVITASYEGVVSNSAAVTVTAAAVVTLDITPEVKSIVEGTTQAFTAIATMTDGSTPNVTNQVTWQSSDITTAIINNAGVASADNVGTSSITAQYLGVTSNTAVLTVTEAVIVTLDITPATVSIAKGTTQALVATAAFSDGTTQDVSDLVTWLSSDTTVTVVNNLGLASADNVGTATVSAQYLGTTSNNVSFTVTAAVITGIDITPLTASIAKGLTQAFVATATFTDDTTQVVTNLATWQSDDNNIVTIDNAGLATGDNIGSANITASYDGFTSAAAVTVTDKVVVDLKVSNSIATSGGGTQGTDILLLGLLASTSEMSAIATYSDGTSGVISNDEVTYITGDDGIVDVDVLGLLTLELGLGNDQVILAVTNDGSVISSNHLYIQCLASVPLLSTSICTYYLRDGAP